MPREESNIPQMTSSFTAFALAPGVFITTIPALVASAIGILLTPAPARAIQESELPNSSLTNLWLLRIKPSGLSATSAMCRSANVAMPSSAILLKVL